MILEKCKIILVKYHLGLFMAMTFMLYSFMPQSSTSSSLKKIKESNLKITTEELFKGVFFADGRIVDLIPTLKEFQITNFTSDTKVIEEYRKMENEVFKNFQVKNSALLKSFETNIKSGNPIEIQETIDQIAPKVKEIINSLNKSSLENSNNIDLAEADYANSLEKSGVDKNDVYAVAAFTKSYIIQKKATSLNNKVSSNYGCVMGLVVAVVALLAFLVAVVGAFALWLGDDAMAVNNVKSKKSLFNTKVINEIADNLVTL